MEVGPLLEVTGSPCFFRIGGLSMAEPPIKITLESAEFTTDVTPGIRSRLLSCLRSDPQHILPKYRGGRDGKEVEAIQQALKKINATWPAEMKMPEITDKGGRIRTNDGCRRAEVQGSQRHPTHWAAARRHPSAARCGARKRSATTSRNGSSSRACRISAAYTVSRKAACGAGQRRV